MKQSMSYQQLKTLLLGTVLWSSSMTKKAFQGRRILMPLCLLDLCNLDQT